MREVFYLNTIIGNGSGDHTSCMSNCFYYMPHYFLSTTKQIFYHILLSFFDKKFLFIGVIEPPGLYCLLDNIIFLSDTLYMIP